MTFDEYNTDENFDNDKSSLEELVKKGKEEGKSKDEIRKALSPKWQKSSKINKFDEYYGEDLPKKKEPSADDAVGIKALKSINAVPEAPKSNPPEKPAEEKTAPKVEEMTQTTEALEQPKAEKKKSNLDDETKSYMDVNSEIANTAEDEEYDRQAESLEKRWGARLANIDKMSDSMSKIDDHLIDQLPTFMFKRYQQGEFGDPKSSDAKLRLAYFAMNNVVSKLKQFANASAAARGQGTLFQNTESAYDQYQANNLQKGMENRWKKYEAETQSAIDLAKQGGMSEEAITDSIATISSNNRLQSKFNMMNERQKVFALKVLGEIGDKLGNMNDAQFANTLMGMSAMGESLDPKEAAGMLVYRTVKDPKKRDEILSSLGLLTGGMGGGLGGLLGGKGEDEKGETGTTLEDGTKVDPGKNMSKDELAQLRTEAEKLGNKFYNGEMTEEEFRKEYAKLEGVMKQHGIRNAISGGIMSQDDYLKQIRRNKRVDLSSQIDALNAKAKNGEIKPSEYDEKFKALKAQAAEWGASEKDLQSIEKGKVKDDKILKASEKKSKKK
jgi:hypothetical protein